MKARWQGSLIILHVYVSEYDLLNQEMLQVWPTVADTVAHRAAEGRLYRPLMVAVSRIPAMGG